MEISISAVLPEVREVKEKKEVENGGIENIAYDCETDSRKNKHDLKETVDQIIY